MSEPRTRFTRAIEVGPFGDKMGFTLIFDEDKEHFLFDRATARDLALKLLQAIDRSPIAPRALGISVGEDIASEEGVGP